jgi:glycosyltransferase involved in cell wall biosynthesis
MPSAEFIVIGGGCPPALRAELESCAGIVCAGYVADLTIQYEAASLAVAPILSGGGTSIKVLEALSYGIPCVMTTFAGRGLAQMLPASFAQLIAGDADAFARLTLLMLRDPALRESVGDNLRSVLDEHFSYAAVLREATSVLVQARDTT